MVFILMPLFKNILQTEYRSESLDIELLISDSFRD